MKLARIDAEAIRPEALAYSTGEVDVLWVPRYVAKCPECGGRLAVQVTGHNNGKPMDWCIEVDCENEDVEDDDKRHRFWQEEWAGPLFRARRWVLRLFVVEQEINLTAQRCQEVIA